MMEAMKVMVMLLGVFIVLILIPSLVGRWLKVIRRQDEASARICYRADLLDRTYKGNNDEPH